MVKLLNGQTAKWNCWQFRATLTEVEALVSFLEVGWIEIAVWNFFVMKVYGNKRMLRSSSISWWRTYKLINRLPWLRYYLSLEDLGVKIHENFKKSKYFKIHIVHKLSDWTFQSREMHQGLCAGHIFSRFLRPGTLCWVIVEPLGACFHVLDLQVGPGRH